MLKDILGLRADEPVRVQEFDLQRFEQECVKWRARVRGCCRDYRTLRARLHAERDVHARYALGLDLELKAADIRCALMLYRRLRREGRGIWAEYLSQIDQQYWKKRF